MDRKLREAIIHKFDGGPVGVDSLAAAIGEERDTIEDVIEPFLIQQGYLQRTPRGRTATQTTWRPLGLTPPSGANGGSADLFSCLLHRHVRHGLSMTLPGKPTQLIPKHSPATP